MRSAGFLSDGQRRLAWVGFLLAAFQAPLAANLIDDASWLFAVVVALAGLLCLPAALAEGTTQQVASVENLTVNVRCTGSAGIPREELTVRLTPTP